MTVDFQQIKDKQRIVIIGNEGTYEIAKISAHVLRQVNKPFDYLVVGGDYQITDAPIILIQGNDHKIDNGLGGAEFLKYHHHIAVIHHIEEAYPDEYTSFDEYLEQYEKLADQTPKGGTILYNKEDNLAMVISEKDREDVQLIEYESIKVDRNNGAFHIGNEQIVKTSNNNFASHVGAVIGLLQRISIPKDEILEALTTYND